MPPLPAIADTWRITFNWNTIQGITPRNVWHFRKGGLGITDADVGGYIDDAVDAMASPSHLFHVCNDAQVCADVDILKLDGTSATLNYALATNLTGGSGSGQIVPAPAVLTKFLTGERGPARRGRMFQGPPAEGSISNGEVGSTSRGLMQAAWEDFADSLDSGSGGNLVVASYAHEDARDVTTIFVELLLGTQKRRQDVLRNN